MGISKSLKGLFMKKKSKTDIDNSSTDSGIKSPKTKPKRRQSKVYDAKPIAPKLMYGAYNEANAKLVTAEGDYPSNYEHYSNFEPRSQKKRTGILKGSPLTGANMENGMDGSIPGGLSHTQKMTLSQTGFRSGSQLNLTDSFSDNASSCYENFYNFNQPMGYGPRKGPMRTNSMSDMSYVGMPAMNRQMVQPRRPSSRQSVMSGSHSSLMSNNYMPMYPGQFLNQGYPGAIPSGLSRPATGSMTNINQAAMNPQGNSPEWADAMVKMEHCLAMLNQLQMGGQPTPQMMPTTNQQPMLRQIPPFRPTVNQVQRTRSGKVLQPQPDFQERELRKKRRLRKKSDLSKFDMSDLKKKLDVISQEEKEDSDNSLTSQDSKNSAKTSDGGFYESNSGQNSVSTSGTSTPDKEKSDNSGDETSDSGVQTPPPELSDQDDKPEKLEKSSELLTSLDKLRKAGGRTRTRSE